VRASDGTLPVQQQNWAASAGDRLSGEPAEPGAERELADLTAGVSAELQPVEGAGSAAQQAGGDPAGDLPAAQLNHTLPALQSNHHRGGRSPPAGQPDHVESAGEQDPGVGQRYWRAGEPHHAGRVAQSPGAPARGHWQLCKPQRPGPAAQRTAGHTR